ncbi:hypothetical protein BCR44DRAFT_1425500 [Catenaria anguillulae PL171]|uniref:Uncharacterized protein n=1 Tax=Catenaria anguillulae PL171 TaxID=765915 RepID=A0A1Y2I166_9FUNG|nr:hypothetical protein BCR44DRAFT_1425500 [Catenaria anguillulae PL171]
MAASWSANTTGSEVLDMSDMMTVSDMERCRIQTVVRVDRAEVNVRESKGTGRPEREHPFWREWEGTAGIYM